MKRLSAVLLAALMLCGVMASCSKKNTTDLPESPSESTPAEDATVGKDELEDIEDVTPTEPTEEGKVAGIPVSHIIMFGGGLLVAVGALIGISYFQKRRAQSSGHTDDENDEI